MAFNGFPREALAFLEDLSANNNKPWFEAHRADYQDRLLEPAKAFVLALGQRLEANMPGIQYDTRTTGSGSLMRIYRDTRFSQDKTPYKTNLSGMLWEGEGRKTECPAFGFRLTATGMDLMAGMFGFPKAMLNAYRQAVVEERLGRRLEQLLDALRKTGEYTTVGEHHKRVPRGYDADHPRADLFRYNALYAHPVAGLSTSQVTSAELLDACMDHFQVMAPLHRWLVEVMERAGE